MVVTEDRTFDTGMSYEPTLVESVFFVRSSFETVCVFGTACGLLHVFGVSFQVKDLLKPEIMKEIVDLARQRPEWEI